MVSFTSNLGIIPVLGRSLLAGRYIEQMIKIGNS